MRALSNDTIASSMLDCSKFTLPIARKRFQTEGSRGSRRIACSSKGIASSIVGARVIPTR